MNPLHLLWIVPLCTSFGFAVAMTGDDDANAYVGSDGIIRLITKAAIDGERIISISGFYRL